MDFRRTTDRWRLDVTPHRIRWGDDAAAIQWRTEYLPTPDLGPGHAVAWRARTGRGVYCGEYVGESTCTTESAATYATRPTEDVPACLITTLRGEMTPVVGRTGLSARERTMAPTPGAWVVLSTEPGEPRPLGEAGRLGTGTPGWQAATERGR